MSDAAPALRLERVFDCSPEEMWAAWTKPEQYAKWLNPSPGLDLVIHEWDLREGGRMRFDMPLPDGNVNHEEGVFHSLKPHHEIVTGAADKSFLLKATFQAEGARTRLVVAITGVPPEWHEAATQGWGVCLDQLATVLADATLPPVLITRQFDAPRDAVWAAWTEPERFKKWYGPSGHTIPSCTMDVRVGGRLLYCMRGPEGGDFWATGTYRVVDPPRRLVMTECSADEKGNVVPMSHYGMGSDEPMEMLLDLAFDATEDGGTRMTLRVAGLPPGPASEGATAGWNAAFDKLATALAAPRKESA